MYDASQAKAGTGDVVDRIRASNRKYLTVAARNARLIAMIEELAYRDPQFRELKLRIREPFPAAQRGRHPTPPGAGGR